MNAGMKTHGAAFTPVGGAGLALLILEGAQALCCANHPGLTFLMVPLSFNTGGGRTVCLQDLADGSSWHPFALGHPLSHDLYQIPTLQNPGIRRR